MTDTDSSDNGIYGDSGPWVTHLPCAWQAIANPDGLHRLPPRPRATIEPGGDLGGDGLIAWWSPLLHVLLFGCGWPRPDLGVARWLSQQQPTADARLALLDRWWGTSAGELVSWSAGYGFANILDRVDHALGSIVTRTEVPRETVAALQASRNWNSDMHRNGWGNDAMHLQSHVVSPLWESTSGELVVGQHPTATQPGRAVLFVDTYAGWYAALHRRGAELQAQECHRSWQVDVICRPLGWLGTYRQSRASGRWFAGRHRWHELGIP
ncbi:hypothetical protein ACVGOW_09115 [Pseudonocardia saturnea]